MGKEQLLRRLPKTVVRNGEIMSVRDDITALLDGDKAMGDPGQGSGAAGGDGVVASNSRGGNSWTVHSLSVDHQHSSLDLPRTRCSMLFIPSDERLMIS